MTFYQYMKFVFVDPQQVSHHLTLFPSVPPETNPLSSRFRENGHQTYCWCDINDCV